MPGPQSDSFSGSKGHSPLLPIWMEGGRPRSKSDAENRNPKEVTLGLYRVYWLQGGSSVASIYMDESGQRWIAPTNWVGPAPLSFDGWAGVGRLELLATQHGDDE